MTRLLGRSVGSYCFFIFFGITVFGGLIFAEAQTLPTVEVSDRASASATEPGIQVANLVQVEGEHPLAAPIRWAKAGVVKMGEEIQDYSCVLVKREKIDGVLGKEEVLFVKIRHEPFSVYLKYLKPRRFRGREAIYVEGQNGGNILAHGTGFEAILGTLTLAPDSPQAMNGNLHPITDMGIINLAKRLEETGSEQLHRNSFSVNYSDCKLNGVDCVRLEIVNSERLKGDPFHKAHIFVDTTRNIPIRYAAWGWSECLDGELPLLEEYTYLDLKINQKFTDCDFETTNPEYRYRNKKK
ncbi:MAG: DUF1571 domain-containing protein [Planctomycetia bacterium]|nr:DUF1571 domain-containing protein [Planctomycetia bacterium]